jgi:hypothetical protein
VVAITAVGSLVAITAVGRLVAITAVGRTKAITALRANEGLWNAENFNDKQQCLAFFSILIPCSELFICLYTGDWIIREGTVGNKMYFIQVRRFQNLFADFVLVHSLAPRNVNRFSNDQWSSHYCFVLVPTSRGLDVMYIEKIFVSRVQVCIYLKMYT